MITIKISGGLGNQMFQYAFGRSLSLRRQEELALDLSAYQNQAAGDTPRSYKLSRFNIAGRQLEAGELVSKVSSYSRLRQKIGQKFFKDYNVRFHNWQFMSSAGCFDGYFQSYKYFAAQAETIRRDLTLSVPLPVEAAGLLEKIISQESVSIHIRRGDYVTIQKNFQGYGVCSLDYYERAVAEIRKHVKEPHFYIFSDDIQWAKENLRLEDPATYVSEFGFDETVELDLMSKCQHNIIANSTFSWWGAWLNRNPEKIVIAPERWVAVTPYSTEDLLPPEWLKI